MNKYQREITKKVKQIIHKELQENDAKYGTVREKYRDVNHLLNYLDITSRFHFRELKKQVKVISLIIKD